MNRRLSVLKHWMSGKRENVGLSDLLVNLFSLTCKYKAKPKIASMMLVDGDYVVKLRNIANPIYFPGDIPLHHLYQVISEMFYNNWHAYEIEQTKVEPNDVVLDCGAAEGLFALRVAARCKRVYLAEPLPGWMKCLEKTFRSYDNVEIIHCALGSRNGECNISGDGLYSAIIDSGSGVKVAINTIDSLFYSKNLPVTYLKADVEGYEMELIEGAANTISRYRPKIAITTYHKPEHYKEITAFLKKVEPNYRFLAKGIEEDAGGPVMLHAWI